MITWGLVSSATMFVRSAHRFLRDAVPARRRPRPDSFRGIIFYLTRWFPARERARTIAAFMTATLVAGIVGGPVSGALLSLHGPAGLAGWQWLFLLEGLPAVVLGFVVLRRLPERPDERDVADARRSATALSRASRRRTPWPPRLGARPSRAALEKRPRLAARRSSTSRFRSRSTGWASGCRRSSRRRRAGRDFEVGLLQRDPLRRSARRHGRRRPALGSHRRAALARRHRGARSAARRSRRAVRSRPRAVARRAVARDARPRARCSARSGRWRRRWSADVGAAAGIALINSVGNIGGFVGPYLLGYVRDTTHSFTSGLMFIGAVLACGGLLALAVRDEGSG